MNSESVCGFRQAASALGPAARHLFDSVGEQEMALAGEIRLRAGSPAVISLPAGPVTIGTSLITENMLEEMVLCLCGHSIYTHQQEMATGYISVAGGHRAGICGTAVIKDGRLTAVRDVKSICLRIARVYDSCASALGQAIFSNGLCSAIIAGAPCSGKTTLLRDIAAGLSGGKFGRRYNVAVVDERGELAIKLCGNDPLRFCDVLRGYPKAEGILQAVRSLSPDVVICDEIGGDDDINAVRAGVNAGVCLICSIHAGCTHEFIRRPQTAALLDTRAFEKIAFLEGRQRPGTVSGIFKTEDIYEAVGCGNDSDLFAACGNDLSGQTAPQSVYSRTNA